MQTDSHHKRIVKRAAGAALTAAACLALGGLAACDREERGYDVAPPSAAVAKSSVRQSDIDAGTRPATDENAKKSEPHVKNAYEENAYAISQGKRLYEMYNCVGCHAHGGGDKGPALMDEKWIYGGEPENIHETIVQGRPNGMPSFSGKIPDYQIWQIVAYVRSLSGNASQQASPGRDDHMYTGKPPNSTKPQPPENTG